MLWKQLINDVNIQKYSEKLKEIAGILQNECPDSEDNPGLMGGKVGVATFLFYYAKFYDIQEPYDYALELLTSVFNDIENGFNFHTHASGLAGIGTVIELLIQEDLIEADVDEVLGELDDFLYEKMILELKKSNYDFLHGAVGIGLYFLKRKSNKKSHEFLKDFVHELDNIAHKDEEGIKWISVLNREKGTKGYNLSLSHGLASIIAFLSKLYTAGIAKDKVFYLLNGAVKYLLNQQMDISKFNSNFPSFVFKDEPSTNSRLAWCYGDLGIGIALWQAGNNTNKELWKEKAIEILLHSAKRRDLKENIVVDAGLCHGSAGIAHIYSRMYSYTDKNEFKDSAEYWFEQSLQMAKFDDGLAGYKVWRAPEYGGSQNDFGFLEGIAGIGLSFISAISDIEPKWDECLLLS
jgi:lantibiotic modifying enzyme